MRTLFLAAALQAETPEPNAALLAQADDRCMTSYAVRLTRTDASDDAIYEQARAGCQEIEEQLMAAIGREYPPAQATDLRGQLEQQRKPNFMALLQRIRADRAARAAQ